MYALFKTRKKKKRAFTWTYIDHTVVVSANIFPCRARTVRRFSLSPSLIVRQEVGEGRGARGETPRSGRSQTFPRPRGGKEVCDNNMGLDAFPAVSSYSGASSLFRTVLLIKRCALFMFMSQDG